jgi:predicted DNA-binding protein
VVRIRFANSEEINNGRGQHKVTFSSSLPLQLKNRLEGQSRHLNRNKADIIRTALDQFLALPVKKRDAQILVYYGNADRSQPRPFTTSLPETMKDEIAATAATLMRPKADVLRAALWHLFGRDTDEQEKQIRKYLSGDETRGQK